MAFHTHSYYFKHSEYFWKLFLYLGGSKDTYKFANYYYPAIAIWPPTPSNYLK